MSPQAQVKRQNAVRVADALNKIEGVPVTAFARELSMKWSKGEITGEQMKAALIAAHKNLDMNDLYLIENSSVLKNLLGITDDAELDLAEAELSRANMMLLYEQGFDDFTPKGICEIHKTLFGDVYDWAGEYRKINIRKREQILAGASVWYSDCNDIERDLSRAWKTINKVKWDKLTRENFVKEITHKFPPLWQVHPFREGNTRTVVLLMTFFIEHYGYYFDQELMAESAGYVRNAFVLASLDKYSEFEHLEAILNDAICTEPIEYDENNKTKEINNNSKYEKYKTDYKPTKHEYTE